MSYGVIPPNLFLYETFWIFEENQVRILEISILIFVPHFSAKGRGVQKRLP